MIGKGLSDDIDPDRQSEQFLMLMQRMSELGYEHYEVSNFSKPGFRSRHNSSYWKTQKYLGIGPSAHSYNGAERQWNTANNNIYIDSIGKGVIPSEKEILTPIQKLNEHIMTSLRTIEGLDLNSVEQPVAVELKTGSKKYIERGLMIEEENHLRLTTEGKLFADGIAADLFLTKTVLPTRSAAI